MHRLARQVRFSINPFAPADTVGANSFASNPPGEGLSIYLSLWVEIIGTIDSATGFVVNVTDIDSAVRGRAVKVFGDHIRSVFSRAMPVDFEQLGRILVQCWEHLKDAFRPARLASLKLDLNPSRQIAIDSESGEIMYISEKFEFAATHTLWNPSFSEEKNFAVFGKCANPTGHGHNYVVEVELNVQAGKKWAGIGEMERIVDSNFISAVDHKNLNTDVSEFRNLIPTVENIAIVAWNRLHDKFAAGELKCVNVWETDKTYCSYSGEET
jgi:6-pyruvoyltetrahydropterin/6-carboxytetrahydropterin synthase